MQLDRMWLLGQKAAGETPHWNYSFEIEVGFLFIYLTLVACAADVLLILTDPSPVHSAVEGSPRYAGWSHCLSGYPDLHHAENLSESPHGFQAVGFSFILFLNALHLFNLH